MNLFYRSIASLAVLFGLAVMFPASARAELDYTPFQAKCMQSCFAGSKGQMDCPAYCGCMIEELRKKHDDKAEQAAQDDIFSTPSMDRLETEGARIPAMCSGVQIRQTWIMQCVNKCGGDKGCMKSCACLTEKVAQIGDTGLGKLAIRLAWGDQSAQTVIQSIFTTCMPQGKTR